MPGPKSKPQMPCTECLKIKTLCRGYCLACYRRLKRHGILKSKPSIILPENLSTYQQEILEGSLLGDGCIYRRLPTHNPYYTVQRQLIDEQYLNWQVETFNPFVSKKSTGQYFDHRTQKYYKFVKFTTRRSKVFETYYNNWYVDGVKILPQHLELTPLSLAIWFADDGHVRSTCSPWRLRMKLSTNGFTKDEVERLTSILNSKFDGKFNTYRSKKQYVIDASDAGTRAFCKVIDSYYPPGIDRKTYWRNPIVKLF